MLNGKLEKAIEIINQKSQELIEEAKIAKNAGDDIQFKESTIKAQALLDINLEIMEELL